MTLNLELTVAYFNLGLMYQQRGLLGAAIENYRHAIENQPEYVAAYNNLGTALVHQGNLDAAREIYEQALKINPNWATLHNNLGKVFQSQGKLDQALKYFRKAIELDPNMVLAHYNLGRIWWQERNYEAAVACFEEVIARNSGNVKIYSDCGALLIAQGEIKKALTYFRKAIALEPAFVTAHCRRAKKLTATDLLEQAKISSAKFLTALLEEEDLSIVCEYLWQTYSYLGEVSFKYGENRQATRHYQQAIQINPKEVALYLGLGKSFVKEGRREAGAIAYHLGLSLQPQHPEILLELGKLQEKEKHWEKAIDYYKQVLQIQTEGKGKLSSFSWQESPFLVQGIYLSTKEWFKVTEIKGVKYEEINWGKDELSYTPSKGKNTAFTSSVLLPTTTPAQKLNCGGVTCNLCMNKLCKSFDPTQVKRGVYEISAPPEFCVEQPQTFVVEIPEGKAWIAPQTNSYMICKEIAITTPDNYLLGEVSRFYPWYLPGCKNHDPSTHSIFRLDSLPQPKKIPGKVAILSSLSAQVYYHWMIDVLPRIGILRQSGVELEEIDWFVVNSREKAYQRETLESLGIPLEKVIESDRHPHIIAENLIVPSFAGELDWPGWGSIEFLRDNFLPGEKGSYPDKIYISRAQAKYRQVINEQAVRKVLSKYGFTTVLLEEMSVAQQAALFASAKIIVTPHGAGMTNIVFCRKGTKIVEFFSPRYVRSDYWVISQQLGLKHYYLLSENFQCSFIRQLMYQTPLVEDILVPLNSLKAVLEIVTSRKTRKKKQ